MLLGEIRDYIQRRGNSSLQDIALHFDIAPDTARFALGYWQRKGKVRELTATTSCGSGSGSGGGCDGCSSNSAGSSSQHYEWVKREIPLQWMRRDAVSGYVSGLMSSNKGSKPGVA